MSTTEILVIIAQQIFIYGGIFIVLFGIFGSAMIIIIFRRRPFNQNPCSIYIMANGILSLFFLPFYCLPNILIYGFSIDWFTVNTPWCKYQISYSAFTITSVFIINCLISFDRYAMSSQSVRIRSLSTKKIARILLLIGLSLVFCLISIPGMILFENVSGICASKARPFLLFTAFVYFSVIEGILPIILAIYSWFVIRKQIHRFKNQYFIRYFDKQITRIYFTEIIICAITSFPFAAINLYRSITIKVIRNQDEENLIEFIRLLTICLFYFQYCCDFYLYAIISKEIRNETKKNLCFCRRYWNNRINVV